MTKKSLSKAFKSIIVFLSVLCLFCACAFAVACDKSTDSESGSSDTTTYTYNETDTEIISNRLFKYGTYDKTADDFPITSLTGWTKSTDNSAYSSSVDSGVISVANSDAWDKVFDKLYAKSDFVKVYENKYPAIKDKSDDEKKTDIKGYFSNPGVRDGAEDKFIYMLNNFTTSTANTGTAQRLRSSSSVSVKKGEVYKVSVWVYTNIISSGANEQGANIRFTNAVKGNSQAEFRIDNVKTDTWKEYTVYFVAHEDYDCTFTLTLGLGYGNGANDRTEDYVMGTAFFDDVTVEKVNALPTDVTFKDNDDPDDNSKKLSFGSDKPISLDGSANNVFKYDMNFDTSTYFATDYNISADYTKSENKDENGDPITSQTKTHLTVNGYSYDPTAKVGTVDLNNKASYTLTIKKNATDNFEITTPNETNYETYMLVSFKLQNKLDKLGSTDITINVKDVYNGETNKTNGNAVATFSTVNNGDEFTDCNIIVKNNFKNQTRNFYLELVIGPTDPATVTEQSAFASGTVKIKDVKTATGYISSDRYLPDKTNDPTYKLYSFFNSNADATVALYSGYEADYSEHNHDSFTLTPAKSNIGEIIAHPTAVNGYNGLTANHPYVKTNGDTAEILNGRTAFSANGYAGLINTKYFDPDTAHIPQWWNGYDDAAQLKTLLAGLFTAEENIQPIVIYNNYTENKDNHYGFIGTQQTVSASAYAKVTVKLKAFDDAKAYIYLVDTSNKEKDVLQFTDFTVNTADGLKNAAIKDHTYSAADHKFMIIVGSDAEVGDDKWVEINFYIATGATEKSFRVEVWNGGRDGSDETASKGYVIVNSVSVSTSSAFTEPTSWQSALDGPTGGPLSGETISSFNGEGNDLIAYTRELTDKEKEFNKEYPDKAVSYNPSYVWANNANMIYAVFNTIDPVEHNPYDDITPEEDGSGCGANSDPSAFWMSFSTILLAVVLVGAIVALFIKRYAAKRRANKSDAVSQYKVKSRSETQKELNKAKAAKAKKAAVVKETTEDTEDTDTAQNNETEEPALSPDESTTENSENTENAGDDTEQTGYVYGEVQDFGDMSLEIPEENKTEENAENKKDE